MRWHKYLLPAVAVTLTQGVGPLSMTAHKMYRGQPVTRVTRTCHGVILVAAALMCAYVVEHRITTGEHDRIVLLLAILAAVVCSISITATLILSRTFADAKVPATRVLSVRFPLLIVTCLLVLPTQHDVRLSGHVLAIVVAVALLGIATAAYFLQRGVELAPPLAVSTCLALSPIVVFAIDAVRSNTQVNLAVLWLISVIVVVSTASIVYDGTRLLGIPTTRATAGPVAPAELECPQR